jgi:hypothetical protein
MMTDKHFISKACAIQQRSPGAQYPSGYCSSIEYRDRRKYVVLRNTTEVLGVWRANGDKIRRVNYHKWQSFAM